MINKWLTANLRQTSHYLGDCPECSALCAELTLDAVLGTPLSLVEAAQKRLQREDKRSTCFQLFRDSKVCSAWLSKHKSWFGYESGYSDKWSKNK